MVTIDAETRRKANLRVLQRLDSNIVDLAITATHVVLYEYSTTTAQWEKKNVEGSLFVTKRSDAPRFKLIILNRSSTENLEVPITATFQMQVKEPYMIFRDGTAAVGGGSSGANETIRGIWFHDGKERDQIASYLEQVVKNLGKIEEMERNQQQQATSKSPSSSNDINDTIRKDAGAALLSTLTLGSNNNKAASAAAATSPSATTQQYNTSPGSSTHQNLVLDKKSLQLSLLSLIQDDRFLDLIHAQYLKVVHTRATRLKQQQQQQQQKGNGGS